MPADAFNSTARRNRNSDWNRTGSRTDRRTGAMAKKTQKSTTQKASTGKSGGRADGATDAAGKHLVIVESPAKAKTINKYLGPGYVVKASVGHVRDLPKRNPKGVKAPVPGVDLEADFAPTYEVIEGKGKTITDLKRAAKSASDIWLATDLDREGEAIAWHLAEALKVPEEKAKRVVFNAITKDEIRRAFEKPRPLNMDKVNAQQARRILDRIVGYQVSPLLWKKVAGGLSAGRVQSVAVRLIVEREREIDAFNPEEYWKVTGYFTADLAQRDAYAKAWRKWLDSAPEKSPAGRPLSGRTVREKNAWLNEHESISAELVEVDGERFEPKDQKAALAIAKLAGFALEDEQVTPDPKGKGPAANKTKLIGTLAEPQPDWRVRSIKTKRTRSRPYPPYITSTLQQAAANVLSFAAQTTMRTAQQLYEGVEIAGMGSVGLITYMRTDSTFLSNEAINMARGYIEKSYGSEYLPEKPNFYRSSNKAAQEAHEAIRPTDVTLHPDDPAVKRSLDERQYKLYRLIWQRFVACQMTPAEWDSTAVLLGAKVSGTDLVFKCTGRHLVFDGFYRAIGVPNVSDDLILPKVEEGQPFGAIQMDPTQHFTSPPPRYTEASLVKKLEAEGIGRPSTYASIISVIQNRKYVEKQGTAFHATDLGMVVTDKLIEGFPTIMDVGYTRAMEAELDAVEDQHNDWVQMLHNFYGPFRENLAKAHDAMTHAKAETEPAPHTCPECGASTVYRFGRNGRFLSCSRYPDCKYAAPIDKEGNPQTPELTEVACPNCGRPMLLRKGRFGPFLSCSGYPDCKGIVNIDRKGFVTPPKVPPVLTDIPCPKCQAPMNLRSSKRGPWLSCSKFPKCRGRLAWTKLPEDQQKKWELILANHEKENPQPIIKTIHGKPIGDEYKPTIAGSEEEAGEDSEVNEDLDAA
ncbi:MAG: type I DNA topoisomerase [Planctomycetes bacterium]|nr:type I DNA topoisomerase [Planctomycetota bacterium]